MGCGSAKGKKTEKGPLSEKLRLKCLEIFQSMDQGNNKVIDKEQTKKFWKANFANLNTEELFKYVDFDNSGQITEDEWIVFWEIVKKSGHLEEEIEQELDELKNGKAWAQFQGIDEFIKKEQSRRSSQLNIVIEQKRNSVFNTLQKQSLVSLNQKKPLNPKNY